MADVPPPPTTAAEARKHIESIRRDNGLESDSARGLKGQFQKLLNLVGEQLYQESTHFLFELIQNADDNAYAAGVTPTLEFTLSDKYLRVDCNEIGFQPDHIQALCSVAMSTKAVAGKGLRYVGEKGLGFKSVFKVADVVWICSGLYTFKLDKRTELGMIGPIWDDFPLERKSGYTSFYLQLSPKCNKRELSRDLSGLDGRSLIFLRRLTNMKITIPQGRATVVTLIRKETKDTVKPGMVVTTLHRNEESQTFVVYKEMLKSMPKEEKRIGGAQSEVCIAFPLDSQLVPQIGPQSVYAFLPIRSYGFSLLLHGDFILTASRQDLEIGNSWNYAIKAGLRKSVLKMFEHFSKSNSALRYTWIRYIPHKDGAWSTFNSDKDEIRSQLQVMPLFEPEIPENGRPIGFSTLDRLRYVPAIYRDEGGVPITQCRLTAAGYLSGRYTHKDVEILKEIDLKIMGFDGFLSDLEVFVNRCPEEFRARSVKHHSSLARVLLPHVGDSKYTSRIRALPIIWVRGGEKGSWIAATKGKIFFPGDSKAKAVPGGVRADIVQPEYANDQNIKLLYVALGVSQLSADEICQLIVATHKDSTFKPRTVQADELVAHAIYLFKSKFQKSQDACQLWVYTERGEVVRAHQAYLDLDIDYAVATYLPDRTRASFLHATYMDAAGGRAAEFQQWVQMSMGVFCIPRLATITNADGRFEITPEFKLILETVPSVDVLLLLKDNWEKSYSFWFHADQAKEPCRKQSMDKLKQIISHTDVECMRNKRVPLYRAFIPLRELLSYASQVPLLNVPDGDQRGWEFLKLFGVGVKKNVRVFLDCLRRFPTQPTTDTTLSEVSALYDNIQRWTQDDAEAVRNTFKNQNLIFSPGTESSAPAWLSLKHCTWDGPDLRYFKSIKSTYPRNETLFCSILQLKDLEVEHLLHEMCCFNPNESLAYFRYIFNWLYEYHHKAGGSVRKSEAPQIAALTNQKVFPVDKYGRSGDRGYTSLEDARASSRWFISDRQDFDRSFKGKAPLLAFDWETNEKFKDLFETMGLKSRMLSVSAKTSPIIEGPRRYHDSYTKLLRLKVDFMIRLIPEKNENRKQVASSLRNLQVFGVKSLKRRWRVNSAGVDIYGDPTDTKCILDVQGEELQIFLLEAHLKSSHFQFQHTLAKLLSDYCDAENHLKYLMNPVITERNHKVVNEMFAEEGVRNLTPDEERERNVSYFRNIENDSSEGGKTDDEGTASKATASKAGGSRSTSSTAKAKVIAEGHTIPRKIRIYDARGQPRDNKAKKAAGKQRTKGAAKRSTATGNDSDTGTLEFNLVSSDDDSSDDDDDDSGYGEGEADGESGVFAAFIEKGNKALRKRKKKTATPSGFDEELAAAGEYFISRLLTSAIPDFYVPAQHWTSKYREIADVEAIPPSDLDSLTSSFTIPDQYGSFTRFLESTGLSECRTWLDQPPIYHIEVITTQKDQHSSFFMRKEWWRMARRHADQGKRGSQKQRRGNVCLLIRVYNWSRTPEVAFYLDPWNHFMTGHLKLEPESMYKGRIRRTAED